MKIQQRKNKKVPGGTSFFCSFDYNSKIIDNIKEIGGCYYDKKTHEWEVPLNKLSILLDKISPIEEIEIYFLEEKEKEYKLPVLKDNYNPPPFDYQLEGIEYGLNHDKWLMLFSPGLGKTFVTIHLAEELKEQAGLEHCLIICGINTLKSNWEKEIKKFSNLSCCVLGKKINSKGKVTYGSISERAKQLREKIDEFFIITNIETFRSEEILDALKNSKNKIDMEVIDEIHKCKSATSLQGKNILKLPDINYKVALTGTLIMNNPLDCYVPLKWIGAENVGLTNFKSYYCEYGGPFNNIIVSFKNTDMLKYQINKFSLRKTKDILNLPPKIIVEELLDMEDRQQSFYDNIKEGVKEEANKVELNTSSLLSLVTRLRQASVCPSILTTEEISSVKIDRACDLVEEITSSGNKIVIFSAFKEPLNILNEKLKQYNPLLCTGDIPDSIISENIDKFQKEDKYKVILCTHSKMGTGVTLTAATYEIFLDSCWTSALEEQCEDRCHRIGTKDNVTIYKLICKDTIDERVADIIKIKGAISDYLVDNKVSESGLELLRKYINDL